MIHPSYVEMIDAINERNNPEGDKEDRPLVTSRYSVVLATAKRARQLTAGAKAYVPDTDRDGKKRKALSVAVDELYEGKVNILPNEDDTGGEEN